MQTRLFFDFFPPKPHYSNNLFYPPFYTTLNECSIIRHKNNKERERETEGFFKKKSWSGEREFFFITREREKRERERDLFIERERETTNPPDTPFYQFIYYAKRKIRKKQIQKRERERKRERGRAEGRRREEKRKSRSKKKKKKKKRQPSAFRNHRKVSCFSFDFDPLLPRPLFARSPALFFSLEKLCPASTSSRCAARKGGCCRAAEEGEREAGDACS